MTVHRIRLLLAEDHAIVRDGMTLMLSTQPDMALAGQTGDGARVLPMVRELQPDVLLLDLGLPGIDGLTLMPALAHESPRLRTLVVTARLDAESVRASLALGARGYLTKSEGSVELLAAIRTVASGGRYISASVARWYEREADAPHADLEQLTAREREVLARVGRGLSSKEIGRLLGISDLTVRKHREHLCRKLGLRNAAEMAALAIRYGLSDA